MKLENYRIFKKISESRNLPHFCTKTSELGRMSLAEPLAGRERKPGNTCAFLSPPVPISKDTSRRGSSRAVMALTGLKSPLTGLNVSRCTGPGCVIALHEAFY